MTTPNPDNNTINVALPDGMTVEQFHKSFDSFNKMRNYTAKRDKAVRDAHTALKVKYPTDYKAFLDKELLKVGLPIK